jgi:hypothetical protein
MLRDFVKMTGTVNDTVNFDNVPSRHVENKIRFDNEHPIPECPKLFMLGNAAEGRVCCKLLIRLSSLFVKDIARAGLSAAIQS